MKTICTGTFGSAASSSQARARTKAFLRAQYGSLVHPGAWITWIWENAPGRFAQLALELRYTGSLKRERDLRALIAFHDSKRLYPREALIDVLMYVEETGKNVPRYLTLNQARKLARRFGELTDAATALNERSTRYYQEAVRPFLPLGSERRKVAANLSTDERLALAALCVIQDRDGDLGAVKDSANAFEPSSSVAMSQFLWNPCSGVAFVARKKLTGDGKGRLWLWATKTERVALYNLTYWRSVRPSSTAALRQLQRLSFVG